jgi:GTP cyclohydrolase II
MNLVDLVSSQLTGDVLGKLGGLIGANESQTRTASNAAVPALLSALSGLASTNSGADKLASAMGGLDLKTLGNLAGLLGGGQASSLGSTGGDLLGSLRCDCGEQLRGAIGSIDAAGGGVLLYMAQEGRGIGLVNKLRAYQLQDAGLDTVDANEALGFDADERVYLPAAEMLRQLGVRQVRLMTNNPDKVDQLSRWGVPVVERVPHIFPGNGHNEQYLRTKAERSGHMF